MDNEKEICDYEEEMTEKFQDFKFAIRTELHINKGLSKKHIDNEILKIKKAYYAFLKVADEVLQNNA